MISKFTVENFKSINEKVLLTFEATSSEDLEEYYVYRPDQNTRLLKLGLIYGANASGKTTVLEALNFLRNLVLNPEVKKTVQLFYAPFADKEITVSDDSKIELEFFQGGTKYFYSVRFDKNAIIEEHLYFYKPKKALVFHRSTDTERQLTRLTVGSKMNIAKKNLAILEANTLWNNSVLGGFIKTNISFPELMQVTQWFRETLMEMVTPRSNLQLFVSEQIQDRKIRKDLLLQILKKADFNISDVIFLDEKEYSKKDFIHLLLDEGGFGKGINQIQKIGRLNNLDLIFQHKIGHGDTQLTFELPWEEESRGTQRYYELGGILSMMIGSSKVFPIDEIESSLHPDLVKHFLLSFLVNTDSSQVIATTHYRELLLEKDILRRDTVWFTEKGNSGSTELFSLDDFESGIVRNTSSFFNAYKAGKLGAVPELSDFYLEVDHVQTKK